MPNRHDDTEYKVKIRINGEEFTQQVFGPRNERIARDHHKMSVEANNKAHPDNKIEVVSFKRVTDSAEPSESPIPTPVKHG